MIRVAAAKRNANPASERSRTPPTPPPPPVRRTDNEVIPPWRRRVAYDEPDENNSGSQPEEEILHQPHVNDEEDDYYYVEQEEEFVEIKEEIDDNDDENELPQPEEPANYTVVSVWVMTPLSVSISDPPVFQNVMKRVQERTPLQSYCIHADELFIRPFTDTQLDRLFNRLNDVTILDGTTKIRLERRVSGTKQRTSKYQG